MITYTDLIQSGIMSHESLDRYMNDATEGDPVASYHLGLLYLSGDDQLSVQKDELLAMAYMRHAADSGVMDAQLKMALCFQLGLDDDDDDGDGNRWPKDSAEAIYYYRLGTIPSYLSICLSYLAIQCC